MTRLLYLRLPLTLARLQEPSQKSQSTTPVAFQSPILCADIVLTTRRMFRRLADKYASGSVTASRFRKMMCWRASQHVSKSPEALGTHSVVPFFAGPTGPIFFSSAAPSSDRTTYIQTRRALSERAHSCYLLSKKEASVCTRHVGLVRCEKPLPSCNMTQRPSFFRVCDARLARWSCQFRYST